MSLPSRSYWIILRYIMDLLQRHDKLPKQDSGATLRYITGLSHSKTWAAHYNYVSYPYKDKWKVQMKIIKWLIFLYQAVHVKISEQLSLSNYHNVRNILFKGNKHYLEELHLLVDIITDYKNLIYFFTIKILIQQQACWSEYLLQFNLVVYF